METTSTSSRVNQVVTEILQQMKRYETRLLDTSDYTKRHIIVHTINIFYKDIAEFNELRTRLEASIPHEQSQQPKSTKPPTSPSEPSTPSQSNPETGTSIIQPNVAPVSLDSEEAENLPIEAQMSPNIRAEKLLWQDFGLVPSQPELEDTPAQQTPSKPETTVKPDSDAATDNPVARKTENIILSRAYCLLGEINFALENYDISLQNYNQALKLNSKEARGYTGIAQYHYKNSDYQTATVISSQAIALDPNEVDGYAMRASAFKAQKQFSSAVADFEKAIEFNPTESYYFAHLGYINYCWGLGAKYLGQKEYYCQKSVSAYSRALELDPTNVTSLNSRGLAFLQLKKYASAIADFEQANKLDPVSGEKFTSKFGHVKPVSSFLLVGFMLMCAIIYGLPFLLTGFPESVKIPLWLVLAWFLLIGVCIWGKLKLKDFGFEVWNMAIGLGLIVLTALLYQVLGRALKVFTDSQSIFQPFDSPYFYSTGEVIRDLVGGTLPVVITQELLFRGFLVPQIFLKLKGPNRVGGTLVIVSSLATLLQFLFIVSTKENILDPSTLFFNLLTTSYMVTGVYLVTRNLYWCAGISFFLFSDLSTVLESSNSVCMFLVLVLLVGALSLYNLRNPSQKANKVVINDTVDHTRLVENILLANPLLILAVFLTGGLLFYAVLWIIELVFKEFGLGVQYDVTVGLFYMLPWLLLVPEIIMRLKGKPAL